MYSSYLLLQTKFGKKKIAAAKLAKFEEISVVDEVHGRFDLVVRVDVEDTRALEEFLQNHIMTLDEISKCETLIVADTTVGEIDEDEEN